MLATNSTAMKKHEKDDYKSLHRAAKKGDIATIHDLLPDHNINEKNKKEETPLFVAIKYNQEHAAKMLLDNGAYPNTFNKKGIDPLGKAIKNGSVACTRLLVENGANLFFIQERYVNTYYPQTPAPAKLRKKCKIKSFLHATFLRKKLELLALNENNNQ
jgi:ankyrin repeat protein